MKSIILLLVLFLSCGLYSQKLKVTKILETNLFELENGEKVRLYGLSIPSPNDTVKSSADLSPQVLEWEKKTLVNWRLIFENVSINSDGTKSVIAYMPA